MLDSFINAVYANDQRKLANRRAVTLLRQLPESDLMALAEESPEKLAYASYDDDAEWLRSFKGTPLHEKALGLAKQEIELSALETVFDNHRRVEIDEKRDRIRLEKRLLKLELSAVTPPAAVDVPVVTGEKEPDLATKAAGAVASYVPSAKSTAAIPSADTAQGAGAVGQHTADPADTVTEGIQVSKLAAVDKIAFAIQAGQYLAKQAAPLQQALREEIPKKEFAVKKGGPGGTGKYPVDTEQRARSAVRLVGLHGSPSEKSRVYAMVAKQYPQLARTSTVPALQGSSKEAGLGSAGLGLAKTVLRGAPAAATAAKAVPAASLLSAGKNLASSAFTAGGIPQVAKSFGSVAKQFAQKNPLTAAGAAAAGGLLAGKALSRNG